MKRKLKSLLAVALCAVGLSAFAKKPDAVQLWEGGPFFTTCNVGAEKPQDYGYYFWWGDTVGYTNNGLSGASAKWVSVDGKGTTISFSNESPANTIAKTDKKVLAGYLDANGNLKSEYDAARAHLGAPWRMMTKEELDKLVNEDYCQRQWVTTYKGVGVSGFVVKGKSGTAYENNEVFFPAAGYGNKSKLSYVGSSGVYWSSTPSKDDYLRSSWGLDIINAPNTFAEQIFYRFNGYSVRAVKDPPSVKNVKAATHWPWDGKIDITCDLTGTGTVQLVAALVTNGVRLVWDAKADCPAGFNSTDTKVKVTAKKVVPPPPGQLWKDGPIWADTNLGTSEVQDHPEYGAPYNFAAAGTEVAKLGDGWRLPTKDECQSLIDKCDRTWNDTKKGYTFTGRGDYASNSVFLPAAGYDKGSGRVIAGRSGLYWSSEVRGDFYAWAFFFQDGMAYMSEYGRNYGLSIRAVRDAK